MSAFNKSFFAVSLIASLACFSAVAQTPVQAPMLPASTLPVVSLSAQASRPAVNDLVLATVVAEAEGPVLADLSRQVNTLITEALKTSKAYPTVKTQSGNTSTYPASSKSGKIESWRMRSELSLQSSDMAAISELLGKLQTSVGVSSLLVQPSPETRKKAETGATLDAIAAFQAHAKVIADALGKTYKIKYLSTNAEGRYPRPRVMLSTAAMQQNPSFAPAPIEGGESQVTVNISGMIELK